MPTPKGGEKRPPTRGFLHCGKPLITGDPLRCPAMASETAAATRLTLAEIRAARARLEYNRVARELAAVGAAGALEV